MRCANKKSSIPVPLSGSLSCSASIALLPTLVGAVQAPHSVVALPCPTEVHPLSNRKENGSSLRSRVAREGKSNSHRSCFVVKTAMVLIRRWSGRFAILRVRILYDPLSLLWSECESESIVEEQRGWSGWCIDNAGSVAPLNAIAWEPNGPATPLTARREEVH